MAPILPVPRLIALLLATAAAFVTAHLPLLFIATLVSILLLFRVGLHRSFFKFCLVIWLPMTLMLLMMWGIPSKAMESEFGTKPHAAIEQAMVVSLRIALVAAVFQLALLSIPPRLLPATLRQWGVRGEGMVVALGVIAIGPELSMRADQIITARRARGLLGGGRWSRLKEMPRLLRPLFVWSIRSAVHRSEAWEQRALLLRVQKMPSQAAVFSATRSLVAVALSAAFLALAIMSRLPRTAGHLSWIA